MFSSIKKAAKGKALPDHELEKTPTKQTNNRTGIVFVCVLLSTLFKVKL